MPRILLALPVLLVPVAATAQEGPSFDCNDASTRTELAICASPELSQLERLMVQSYEGLAATIGQDEARRIADDLLARRQACEGDTSCIAERLVISMEVFDQRAGRPSQFARLEDILPGSPAREDSALPVIEGTPPVVAAPPVVEGAPPVVTPGADSDLPLAAQAPWPGEAGEPGSEDLSDVIDGAELASSDGAAGVAPSADPDGSAAFDTPLSWAFMDLDREERARIQERLVQAGFLEGQAEGTWTNATRAALEDFVREEGSGSFDLSTETGAALLLDYIGSEAFATAFGVQEAAATPVAAAPAATASEPAATPPTVVDVVDTGDPLAGADW